MRNLDWKKISAAVSAGTAVYGLIRDGVGWYNGNMVYTARVGENDFVYDELMSWLADEIRSSRRVRFRSGRDEIRRMYDSEKKATFMLDGHRITITQEKPGGGGSNIESMNDLMSTGGNNSFFEKFVSFSCKDKAGLDALESKLESLRERKSSRPPEPRIYTMGRNYWENIAPTPRRMESVFLPPGDKESLLEDIEMFFRVEDRFQAMGLPWHRGYLFYGPPGNGKSSLCKAIVNEYKLSMYHMSLSSVKDDSQLTSLFADMEPRSVILLEDVDIFGSTNTRFVDDSPMTQGSNDKGPTLAGLLNCLDGVGTPHGLITVMTTNRLESLDPALIRPGRVDRRLFLGPPVDTQVRNMFKYIYDEPLTGPLKEFDSMSAVTEIFKHNPYDSEAARLELKHE